MDTGIQLVLGALLALLLLGVITHPRVYAWLLGHEPFPLGYRSRSPRSYRTYRRYRNY